MEKFLDHWDDYKIIYLIVIAVLLLISCVGYYEYLYPCVYGHYELQMHPLFDGNGNISTWYMSNDFICDCRTVRDSIK